MITLSRLSYYDLLMPATRPILGIMEVCLLACKRSCFSTPPESFQLSSHHSFKKNGKFEAQRRLPRLPHCKKSRKLLALSSIACLRPIPVEATNLCRVFFRNQVGFLQHTLIGASTKEMWAERTLSLARGATTRLYLFSI